MQISSWYHYRYTLCTVWAYRTAAVVQEKYKYKAMTLTGPFNNRHKPVFNSCAKHDCDSTMLSSEAYNINSAKHVQETLSVKLADNRPCKLCRFLLAVRLYLQTDIDYLIYIKSSRLFQLDALYKLSTHKINLGPDSSLQTARRYRRSGVLSRLCFISIRISLSLRCV